MARKKVVQVLCGSLCAVLCFLNACSMSASPRSAQTGNSAIDYNGPALAFGEGGSGRDHHSYSTGTAIPREGVFLLPRNSFFPLETRDQADCEKSFPGNQEFSAICFFLSLSLSFRFSHLFISPFSSSLQFVFL